MLGDLTEFARQNDALIVIMSDHGHGSLDGKAQPNMLLEKWGYLKIKSRLTQARRRPIASSTGIRGGPPSASPPILASSTSSISTGRATQACVMHAGIYGFLYISLKGRQPGGLVDPADYERMRDDLQQRFLNVTCRNREGQTIQVFPEVYKTEELYKCSREEQPWLPDLLLGAYPGLAVVRKIRGSQPVRWSSRSRMEGTHRVEGILIVNGPHARPVARSTRTSPTLPRRSWPPPACASRSTWKDRSWSISLTPSSRSSSSRPRRWKWSSTPRSTVTRKRKRSPAGCQIWVILSDHASSTPSALRPKSRGL